MTNVNALLDSFIWVELPEPSNFLKIKETLTRIGITGDLSAGKTLSQICHILHKRGRYAIVHYRELFLLDGMPTEFTKHDLARRNTIAALLEEWKLVKILNKSVTEDPKAPMNQIKVISYKDKGEWNLEPKYFIGKRIR